MFRQLYGQLGLVFTDSISDQIISYTAATNRDASSSDYRVARINSLANTMQWKELLTNSEIEAVRSIVSPVAAQFYSADEW